MAEIVIVSDYAGDPLARKIAHRLECQYIPINMGRFPDGETDLQVTKSIRSRSVHFVCPYYPDPERRFTQIYLTGNALRNSSAERIVAVPTYLGFMKQDRKDKPRVPISIQAVAEATERYAHRVITMDMHADQSESAFRLPLDHLDGTVLIAKHIMDHYELANVTLGSPDIGRGKRVKSISRRTGIRRMALVDKDRDVKTGETTYTGVIGDVSGRDVIFYDDQAISLGTLSLAAKAVLERGAKRVISYCSHGIMAPKKARDEVTGEERVVSTAEQRLADSPIEMLYFTDSIPRPDSYFEANPKINLISCVDLFAEAIERNHLGKSLSILFDGSNQ